MKEYSTFIFDSYSFDASTGEVSLKYSLDDEITFEEKLTLPQSDTPPPDAALFALHLIGGTSYYKTCCPQKIEVCSGTLTDDQAKFWNTVYTKGLAEFFFRNDIDPTGLINFPGGGNASEPTKVTTDKGILVPIGGGKDSMVTAELLRDAEVDFTFFRMGSHPVIEELSTIAEIPLVTIERKLDPKLFELNEQGALNGHIPITAYLSFVTILVSAMQGYKAVAMSNERSANFGNVTHHDLDVNHQWSKSMEFEKMMQEYVRNYITTDVAYFSMLRPMSELAISQVYCMHPEYFSTATSCNKNWKIAGAENGWCGTCPKCAFVFCQMAAFLDADELTQMFGKNLFEDEELIPLYKELLGMEGYKPFECVGTPEEVSAAFFLSILQEGWEGTPVMEMFLTQYAPDVEDPNPLITKALEQSDEHAIPPHILTIL